jgi:hypothetical protein
MRGDGQLCSPEIFVSELTVFVLSECAIKVSRPTQPLSIGNEHNRGKATIGKVVESDACEMERR